MLKPALLYTREITRKFTEHLYTTDYFYYCGYYFFSFDKGNPILGIDVFHKLEQLIKNHHRVEWRVVGNNPVKRHYDKYCKRHNGYIHHFHETTKDKKGNYIDSYLYEIINRRYFNAE